jgi:hypothetical protein
VERANIIIETVVWDNVHQDYRNFFPNNKNSSVNKYVCVCVVLPLLPNGSYTSNNIVKGRRKSISQSASVGMSVLFLVFLFVYFYLQSVINFEWCFWYCKEIDDGVTTMDSTMEKT